MAKKTGIKKNFAYQMIYEILVIILPFITSPYISRVLGAERLGEYSYAYSVGYYFVLVAMLGLKNYGNREIARVRDDREMTDRVFSDIFAVHFIVSVIACLSYVAYLLMVREGRLYALILGAYVLSALFDISWFYFGIEKFKLTVTRSTVIKIVNVACVFIFVRGQHDLWKYCLIMSLGFLVSQLTLWVPLKKYVKLLKPRPDEMKKHVRPMLVLFIPALAVSLYKQMDKIMLGAMHSKIQLGYYSNAEKVINIPLTVITSFGTVMLPKMSNLAASKDERAASRYMRLSVQYVMCLAIALAFGLAGVAMVFAPVFWGEEFIQSGYIIIGLSSTIPFIAFANIIRTQYLLPRGKDREYMVSICVGAVLNVIINYLLIPVWGGMGATVGTIAAEASVCIIQVWVVRKELPVRNYIGLSAVYLPVGTLMFILVYLLGCMMGKHIFTLAVQVAAGGILYVLFAAVYFYKTGNEVFLGVLKKLRKILKRV